MGASELLIKASGSDRSAVEGFGKYLKREFEHCFPGPVLPNDRDNGYHCFIHLSIEGSEAAKIRRRA